VGPVEEVCFFDDLGIFEFWSFLYNSNNISLLTMCKNVRAPRSVQGIGGVVKFPALQSVVDGLVAAAEFCSQILVRNTSFMLGNNA
jgi:hypothetical protein